MIYNCSECGLAYLLEKDCKVCVSRYAQEKLDDKNFILFQRHNLGKLVVENYSKGNKNDICLDWIARKSVEFRDKLNLCKVGLKIDTQMSDELKLIVTIVNAKSDEEYEEIFRREYDDYFRDTRDHEFYQSFRRFRIFTQLFAWFDLHRNVNGLEDRINEHVRKIKESLICQ